MQNNLTEISKLVRRYILEATTEAGSGHPTSCLSAVELMVSLMFGGSFRFKIDDPTYVANDRLIFSKGHGAPLLYSLWTVAGALSKEELLTLRKFTSRLEGHPTRLFPYAEVATGSLGQGLSVGLGMALSGRMDSLPFRTYVLLGDSELAEGQNWEAMALATHYNVDTLCGIVDMNRLGQRGETMDGHATFKVERKCRAFGWHTIIVDGHDLEALERAYSEASFTKGKPTMIIAKTMKGKGIFFLEDKNGWHGKALSKEDCKKSLEEIGEVDEGVKGIIAEPVGVPHMSGSSHFARSSRDDSADLNSISAESSFTSLSVEIDTKQDYEKPMATRKAYGHALVEVYSSYPEMVVLDAEMSNSTFAETFKNTYPERFFEMFIAEQNMVSVASGMALRGKIPFVSTFAAFFTRATDQLRLVAYSNASVKFVGSHAGVSIGEDGSSQMGLEDISIFRVLFGSVVLYPADHVATEKLTRAMAKHEGVCYMRTTRMESSPLYTRDEEFTIGGSKVLKQSSGDSATIIGAGVTLYEALKAYELLKSEGVIARVIDLYSIKPLDVKTLVRACKETKALIVVEDHFPEGGMAEAVRSALIYETTPIHSLAVTKMPRSGSPAELLAFEEIDATAIVKKIKEILI
jgi:transketolase